MKHIQDLKISLARFILVCTLLVLISLANAQNSDPLLLNYGLAFENLNEAVTSIGVDSQQSIEALDDAAQQLRPLSTADNGAVIAALERTFERAKTAVQNQSTTDLEVQTSVLKGGFWRLIYESAVTASNDGNLDLAKLRIAQMATDMGLAEASLTAINESSDALNMLSQLESGVTQLAQAKVNQTTATLENRNLSYVNLAQAYSLYLPIQDSPRADPLVGSRFTEAFTALVDNQTEALQNALLQLSEQMGQFANSAQTQSVAQAEASEQAQTNETIAQDVTEATPGTAVESPALAAPAIETTSEVTAEATTEASETVAAVPENEATTNQTSPVTESSITTSTPLTQDTSELQKQLRLFGLPPGQQERLLESYSKEGYGSVNTAIDKLYADSAKITVALSQGDIQRAKSLLSSFQTSYESFLAPILDWSNPAFHQQTQALLQRYSSIPGLRVQEGTELSKQVDAISSTLSTARPSGLTQLEARTSSIWSGWLRLAFTILLGLLAFVPLYLLYLAFGGGNRNWQLVGWALFLLLLPLMYEGLSYLASLISFFTGGIGFLDTLSQFSIFQSTLSQIIWVILSAVAITLAALGLYGICVQFGLLGQTKQTSQTATLPDTRVTETGASSSTFDWDEEF